MASGSGLKVQYGIENTYGTKATPTHQILVSSEGFKLNLGKKDEGLLTGGKMTGRVATMSRKVEGSLSALARPDDVGFFLKGLFGVEGTPAQVGTTDAYNHTFTPISATGTLPSYTFTIDRVVKGFAYTGCKINTMSFNADAEDYLKLDINVIGKDEESGTTGSLTPSALKAFRFANAQIKVNNQVLDATNIKFEYNNNLSQLQTTATGLYLTAPEQGARDVKISADVLYNSTSDSIRDSYFLTDAVVEVVINFVNGEIADDDVPYSLSFTIPFAQVEDASPTISGADIIKYTLSMRATEGSGQEPVKAELVNLRSTAY